jgi:hypothetical protein
MPFDMMEAVDDLRERLGKPLTFEISDETLENAISQALQEFSKFRPRKKVVSIPLRPGVNTYPLEDGVVQVLDCILSFRGITDQTGISPEFSFIDPNDFDPGVYTGFHNGEFVHEGSTDIIREIQLAQRDKIDGYEWEYFDSDNQLYIFPAPNFSGTTVATIGLEHTEASLPNKDYNLMMLYAEYKSGKSLGNFRTKVKEIPTGVGYKMTLDGGETILQESELKREQFYDQVKKHGSPHIKG